MSQIIAGGSLPNRGHPPDECGSGWDRISDIRRRKKQTLNRLRPRGRGTTVWQALNVQRAMRRQEESKQLGAKR